jgi:hypothetical protein
MKEKERNESGFFQYLYIFSVAAKQYKKGKIV